MTTDKTTDNNPGAPKGRGNYLPKRGPWGVGVTTVRVRVPEEIAPDLAHELSYLLWYLDFRRTQSTRTRNWTEFDRLISHLREECPHLMSYTPKEFF